MKERKYKTGGVIGTILFHLLILFCFLFFGFSSPLPPPPEEGVEVNLGYSDDGMGDVQPTEPNSQDASSEQQSSNTNDDLATQNTEETVNIDKKTNNKNTSSQEDNVNKNALYTGKNSNNGGNEGETNKPGDQGDPNGDPNAKNHYGTPGSGISFNLSGRNKKSIPKPSYDSREEGIVVVSIWVDKNGNVTNAIAGARGSTTTNTYLQKIAKEAALKAKFHAKADAPEQQKGTITYNFINLN